MDLTARFDPGAVREPMVYDDHVGPQLLREFDALASGPGFANNDDLRTLLERAAETATHNSLVVHQENAQLRGRCQGLGTLTVALRGHVRMMQSLVAVRRVAKVNARGGPESWGSVRSHGALR